MAGDRVTYEQDVTGSHPDNLIVREPHMAVEIDPKTKDILIPNFPPFFPNDFLIETKDAAGIYTPLVKGVDFDLTLPWYSFEKETGRYVYGGAKVHRKPTTPMLYVTYRTLGGTFTGDRNLVLENLANYVWNPRIVQWDQLTNVQETFPPNQHQQDLLNFVGWEAVETQIERLVDLAGLPQEPTLLFQQQVIAMLQSNDDLKREVRELKDKLLELKLIVDNLNR